jgi:hypothetical protein
MNNEFKKTSNKNQTVYTLESATGMGSGSIASVAKPIGGVRKRGDDLIAQEADNKAIPPSTPRNFVAKNAKSSGAGAHKDKKKAEKQGDVKHKKPFMEDHEIQMASSELMSIAKNAEELLDMVRRYSEQEGLEAWQQSKITKAADYLNSVLQSINGEQQGVAVGSLNEFAPDGFNGGNDGEEFSPEIAKMAQDNGFTKGVSLADGATLERAMKINHWHSQHGGMYKQYFAKGFKEGRMNKINHNNKQYNLNLKLMKDGSIRHGEQGVAEGTVKELSIDLKSMPEKEFIAKYNKSKTEAWDAMKSLAEAFENDESNLFYIYDKSSGRLKQRMIHNNDERQARNMGYKETHDDALKYAGIIRSKFDPKKFVQNMGGKWVQVFPYGEQNVEKEDHSTATSGWGQGSYASSSGSSKWAGAGHNDVQHENHPDEKEDKALIRKMVKAQALKQEDGYMAELQAKLDEKIPKNAPVDVWIKDFEKSNAPQFKGKNLEKRRQMAVAASYSAKNPSKKK